jgi:hypothetical protein
MCHERCNRILTMWRVESQDKPTLFKKFYEWLKPGGRLLISDYCRSPSTPSPEFAAYIDQRGYDLHSVEHYGQVIDPICGRTSYNVINIKVTELPNKQLPVVEKWYLCICHKSFQGK